MANHKGNEGSVAVGANAVAELRSFDVTEKADTIEDTVMGDAAKSFKPSFTEWEGTMTCFWDKDDTNGQEAMTIGAEVTLNLYPEGNTSSNRFGSGSAIITEVGVAQAHDGMVERPFSFKGNGALTWDDVS